MMRSVIAAALLAALTTPVLAHETTPAPSATLKPATPATEPATPAAESPIVLAQATTGMTKLKSSTPADGSEVSGSPKEVTLVFPHPMILTDLTVSPVGAKGKPAKVKPGEPKESVTVPIDPVGPGKYSVAWRAKGADGHQMRGTFRFSVK